MGTLKLEIEYSLQASDLHGGGGDYTYKLTVCLTIC